MFVAGTTNSSVQSTGTAHSRTDRQTGQTQTSIKAVADDMGQTLEKKSHGFVVHSNIGELGQQLASSLATISTSKATATQRREAAVSQEAAKKQHEETVTEQLNKLKAVKEAAYGSWSQKIKAAEDDKEVTVTEFETDSAASNDKKEVLVSAEQYFANKTGVYDIASENKIKQDAVLVEAKRNLTLADANSVAATQAKQIAAAAKDSAASALTNAHEIVDGSAEALTTAQQEMARVVAGVEQKAKDASKAATAAQTEAETAAGHASTAQASSAAAAAVVAGAQQRSDEAKEALQAAKQNAAAAVQAQKVNFQPVFVTI